jgi:hypothetical protein
MVEEHCRAQHITRGQYRFSRRTVREVTRWGDTQLKIHLGRLTELEYLLIHRGGRGQSFEYELLFDSAAHGSPADGSSKSAVAHASGVPHVSGLIDVEALRQECGAQHYDAERSGLEGERSGSGRGEVGPQSAGGRGAESAALSEKTCSNDATALLEAKTPVEAGPHQTASYVPPSGLTHA